MKNKAIILRIKSEFERGMEQAKHFDEKNPPKSFYESNQWRRLRYEAIKRSDGGCTACRRSREKHNVAIHVDHIIPISHAPDLKLEIHNLQILCEDCNLGKGNYDSTNWKVKPISNKQTKRRNEENHWKKLRRKERFLYGQGHYIKFKKTNHPEQKKRKKVNTATITARPKTILRKKIIDVMPKKDA